MIQKKKKKKELPLLASEERECVNCDAQHNMISDIFIRNIFHLTRRRAYVFVVGTLEAGECSFTITHKNMLANRFS